MIKNKIPLEEQPNPYDVMRGNVLTAIIKNRKPEATEMMVEWIKNHNKICTTRDDEKPEMWIYQEGIYKPQGKSFIVEFIRRVLGEAFTTFLGNQVIEKIRADTYIDANEFFQNNYVEEIAVQNGILNLTTRRLSPFTPSKIFFNKIPIWFDRVATCPNIEKHFEAVLKHNEDIPVIYELFGFLLYKDYFIEKAIMLIGTGRNGKGKSLELMKRFLGPDNCVNIPLQDFENDQYAMGELFSKLANLSADINKKALVKTGTFKNLTGRDMVSANRKFLNRAHFQNYAKQIFCANELPITYDTTPAFWNRWVLLEFPFTFLSQKEYDTREDKTNIKLADPEIISKLTTEMELSGLLNLALDGLDRLRKQKDFSYIKSVAEVEILWRRKSCSFNAFMMDCLEEDWEGSITKQELRHAYSDYCKAHKLKMVKNEIILNLLTCEYGIDDVHPHGGERCWKGIKFKDIQKQLGDQNSK